MQWVLAYLAGAFVVLQGGIEGLLHQSEMADGTLSEPYSYVQRGDKVTMRIVRIEPEDKRIGFTQKGFETDESEPVEEVFDEDVFEETDSGDPAF